MSKITNVLIKDKNTLIINQDAKTGDEIDLLSLNKLDVSNIEKQIQNGLDEVYNRKLNEVKRAFEASKELEIKNAIIDSNNKNNAEIAELKAKLNVLEESLKAKYETLNIQKQSELQLKIKTLESELELSKRQIILEKEEEFKIKEQEYKTTIERLTLERSNLNVKRIGERLEHWCENEYEQYSLNGFENCEFYKDNKSIKNEEETKGTKADYIFKVYADSSLNEKKMLTSVACEMKSEDPSSVNKKKNADHYKKLDSDRKKKECEYALLVSELEWNDANDVPIKKVKEYEKMYVVRPQYFITFLNLITSLAKKYQELILEKEKEQIVFKESVDILEEFEKMRSAILDNALVKLEKEIAEIAKQRQIITDAADKIALSTSKMTDTVLENIRKKIDGFNIKKINKKIDKLTE
ncbi:MAG: DUF2130 domain-containing protein [Bacilli bacterium]|nr:DUF2130 domain-containing protein [Bacilli bacterium]